MINSFFKINLILLIIFVFILIVLSGKIFAFDCTSVQKYSHIWQYNNCGGDPNKNKKEENKNGENEKKTTLYNGDIESDDYWRLNNKKGYKNGTWSEIPEDANPSYELLEHYLKKFISQAFMTSRPYKFTINPKNTKEFNFDLTEDDFVTKQLNNTAMLSYLMYENGQVIIDEISPDDRFGHIFKNDTLKTSHSAGKSIMSYIMGHAICEGYIDSINHKLNDWPILENTLYYDQPIINLLNMATGDRKYFENNSSAFKKSKRLVNSESLQSLLENELKDSKATKAKGKKYNYNNMNTNLIASYVLYKMGHKKYEEMLSKIFADKVGIEYEIIFFKPRGAGKDEPSVTYGMYISRYDYLRIAVAMLDDWNNNTCEGEYLKSLYENRIKKNQKYRDNKTSFTNTKDYGGQFHMTISGGKNKNRPVFQIDGWGGQTITIDFEQNKIIAILAIHRDYNWMKLVHNKF